MTDTRITTRDGRTVCFADYGGVGAPVLLCHGGPGSRQVATHTVSEFVRAGFRLIGVDRPGYGGSSPWPGRQIGGWVEDATTVLDALKLDRCFMVGLSTGGAYALATAARAPERVKGVLACCALTDMRWAKERAPLPANTRVWSSQDRRQVRAIVLEDFGADGSKMLSGDVASMLAPADIRYLSLPENSSGLGNAEAFAQGPDGYVDDRLADSPANGWASFDPAAIRCSVMVLHGEEDRIVPVAHAYHTAEVVPGAKLKVFPEHGHISITTELVPALRELARMSG